jgi:pilus assembly protein Flp/PilA
MLTALVSSVLALKTDDKGVTALEYGLIASLIAVAIIGSVTLVGTSLSAVFTNVASSL